jgi:hypothetical protein
MGNHRHDYPKTGAKADIPALRIHAIPEVVTDSIRGAVASTRAQAGELARLREEVRLLRQRSAGQAPAPAPAADPDVNSLKRLITKPFDEGRDLSYAAATLDRRRGAKVVRDYIAGLQAGLNEALAELDDDNDGDDGPPGWLQQR